MAQIGEGLQYRVIYIGDGRVRKFIKGFREQIRTLIRWEQFPLGLIWIRTQRSTIASVRESIKRVPQTDARLIGNAAMLDGGTYDQDAVQTLKEYFETHTLIENKVVIDGYIDNVLALAALGIGRPIFNCTRDHGVYPDGFVCNLDLGEFVFTRAPMLAAIAKKRWLRDYSYRVEITDPALKQYMHEQIESRLSVEKYWDAWGKPLSSS